MGRTCAGGVLDGMAVFIDEDVRACINGGGHIVGSTESGCGASSIQQMALPGQSKVSRQTRGTDAVSAFRKVRAAAPDHPLVQAAMALNAIAGAEVERIGRLSPEMQGELFKAMQAVGEVVTAVTAEKPGDKVYDKKVHAQLASFGRKLAEQTEHPALREGIGFLLSLAQPMVGRSFADIAREVLPPARHGLHSPSETLQLANSYPSAAILTAASHGRLSLLSQEIYVDRKFPSYGDMIAEEARAKAAVDVKARALGWLGDRAGDIEPVAGGWLQRFANADVFVGSDGRAFEVHGDILRKYSFLHGPDGTLGFPVTDETTAPDTVGRFNHFEHGSIYWTPHTGPMMVGGVIRNVWAAQGWELGPMGYPVVDEYRLPGLYPPDKPNLAWSQFENGAIFAQGNAAATALAAEIHPDALRSLVRSFFDRRFHAAGQDLGLEAQVDVLSISGWSYGFLAAVPRKITYRLHGFHSNPIISDTTFDVTVGLRFGTTWSMGFGYPTTMSLIVALDGLSVHASGAGAKDLANGVFNGIQNAFNRGGPDPDHAEVPNGAVFVASFPTNVSQRGLGNLDVISTLVTTQGGLQILVNPLPPSFGGVRRYLAQNQLDAFLESF